MWQSVDLAPASTASHESYVGDVAEIFGELLR
jgi:hypothetical protein